jgi:membrane-bound lytic murein transglycosylase D
MPSAALLARASAADVDPATLESKDVLAETIAVEPLTPNAATIYKVRPGDTLYEIAKRHGTTVERLRVWNNLHGSKLNVGDKLVVASPKTANTQQ